MDPLFVPCEAADPGFDWHRLAYQNALWTLVHQQPDYLLNPRFKSWGELLMASVDDVIRRLRREDVPVEAARWGRFNRLAIDHPLSRAFPRWLTSWLDMPRVEAPGGANLPRIQEPSFGASERMVIEPGHEAESLFEMPTGQSGNPLSPFYRDEETAWVKGEPTPLLPGPERHRLTLAPR
jgi:penicillin amidase